MSGLLHMYSERRAFMPIYFSVRQKFSGHTPVKNQLQLIFSGETLAHAVICIENRRVLSPAGGCRTQ
jgi:hypothetical protein